MTLCHKWFRRHLAPPCAETTHTKPRYVFLVLLLSLRFLVVPFYLCSMCLAFTVPPFSSLSLPSFSFLYLRSLHAIFFSGASSFLSTPFHLFPFNSYCLLFLLGSSPFVDLAFPFIGLLLFSSLLDPC